MADAVKLIGEYGREVLKMVRLQKQGGQEFVAVHDHAQALQTLMYEVDATYNQNPYQPGVKGGSKYLLPTFNSLFELLLSVIIRLPVRHWIHVRYICLIH